METFEKAVMYLMTITILSGIGAFWYITYDIFVRQQQILLGGFLLLVTLTISSMFSLLLIKYFKDKS